MDNFNADMIFKSWFANVKNNYDIRYIRKERPELIEELVTTFYNIKIPYDEAIFFKKRVVNALTTKEGRKGNGKHKGWKENVEEDFELILAKVYVNIEKSDKDNVTDVNAKINKVLIPEDEWIKAWLKDNFGENYPKGLDKLAHTVGSSLNIDFMKDVFSQEQIKTGKLPKWF